MEKKSHFFYAVKIPMDTKEHLNLWIEKHLDRSLFERWVHPSDFHITLAFLGHSHEGDLLGLTEKIKRSLINIRPFPLTINQLGTFGKREQPRIFWAGVTASEPLYQLQKIVFKKCLDFGFQLDKKPFRPHITLARKYKGVSSFSHDLVNDITFSEEKWATFIVDEIVLYKTNLQQTPKYEVIENIHFNK